jgi:hypothetical protein
MGVWLFAALFIVVLSLPLVVWAQQTDAALTISMAQSELVECFNAVRSAESVGANISSLTVILNNASSMLSDSQLAYSQGNFASASNLAIQSQTSLSVFLLETSSLKNEALASSNLNTIFFVGSIVGTFSVIAVGLTVWVLLKRNIIKVEFKSLNLIQYKFLCIVAILTLLVASPALQRVLVYPRTEFFTEISLLGPEHKAENYPYNIMRNQNYTVYLDVANRLGSCSYYQVQLKFRNMTQSEPDSFNRTSSTLPSLYNFPIFVADLPLCNPILKAYGSMMLS